MDTLETVNNWRITKSRKAPWQRMLRDGQVTGREMCEQSVEDG